jgi:hypothetical protein
MSYISECLQAFRSLPDEIQEEVGGLKAYQKISKLENKHKIQLGFLVVLVTIGELLMPDIEEYLVKKFYISKEKAARVNQDLQEQIFTPAIKKIFPGLMNPLAGININKEKDEILEIFKSGVIKTMTRNLKSVKDLNLRINYVLYKDPEFENVLFKALAENEEKLTNKEFVLNGKLVRPTIGNWLRDFAARQGGGMFDNVVLSKYLISSENAKKLDAEERKLVQKLLNLYRNLRFFLEVTEKLPIEEWQIFPIEKGEETFKKARTAPAIMSAVAPAPVPAIQKPIATPSDNRLNELKSIASQYPVGSLERKAVEEEIRKAGL